MVSFWGGAQPHKHPQISLPSRKARISTSLNVLPRQNKTDLPRKTAAWKRQVWTASFQLRGSRASGAWGPHTPTANYSRTHTTRDTVSCPRFGRAQGQSRPGTASSRGKRTLRDVASRKCSETLSSQTNSTLLEWKRGNALPFNTNKSASWKPGESSVSRCHPHIHSKLRRQDSQTPHELITYPPGLARTP